MPTEPITLTSPVLEKSPSIFDHLHAYGARGLDNDIVLGSHLTRHRFWNRGCKHACVWLRTPLSHRIVHPRCRRHDEEHTLDHQLA